MRSLSEWLLALGILAGVVWAGGPVLRRVAPLPAGNVTLVESDLPALPDGVPQGASNVPLVILLDGTEVRVGMSEQDLMVPALSRWSAGASTVEKGVIGDRIITPYRSGPLSFWIVLDRIDESREREVTAIYVR